MAPRPCLDCHTLIPAGTRCPACTRAHEQQRGTPAQRGYGAEHREQREQMISAEPWCHRPSVDPAYTTCPYGDSGTSANPLTLHHVVGLAHGGNDGRRIVLCRRCNSQLGSPRDEGGAKIMSGRASD